MDEILLIAIRTLFLYFTILVIFRLMGKREIGELSLLDLVVFIMIAEIAVTAIEDTSDPLIHTILPMILLMLVQIALAFASLKSEKVREIIDGKPSVIINKGKIDEDVMRSQRYNLDDLLTQLRERNIKNVSDVEFAILEPSGQLSVFEKEKSESRKPESPLSLTLIKDGVIQEDNLARIHKTNLWLRQQLRARGYRDIKKILYCSYENGQLHIDEKDEK